MNSNQNPNMCFLELKKMILKFPWKRKGPRGATTSLKKQQAGGRPPDAARACYRVRATSGWQWGRRARSAPASGLRSGSGAAVSAGLCGREAGGVEELGLPAPWKRWTPHSAELATGSRVTGGQRGHVFAQCREAEAF